MVSVKWGKKRKLMTIFKHYTVVRKEERDREIIGETKYQQTTEKYLVLRKAKQNSFIKNENIPSDGVKH